MERQHEFGSVLNGPVQNLTQGLERLDGATPAIPPESAATNGRLMISEKYGSVIVGPPPR